MVSLRTISSILFLLVLGACKGEDGGSSSTSTSSQFSSASSQSSLPLTQKPRPAEFLYSADDLPVLDPGGGEVVAATQGEYSVSKGSAQYSIPIKLPPSVNNLAPKLSVNYTSRSNVVNTLGVGWSVSGLSAIHRCRANFATEGDQGKKSNPKYTNSDRLCLDGQKLILENGPQDATDGEYWSNGATYVTERDSLVRIHALDQHDHFIAYRKNGEVAYYGSNTAFSFSKGYMPGDTQSIVNVWGVERVEDRYGNAYTVEYVSDFSTSEFYPKQVNLTPGARVVFNYEERLDGGETYFDHGVQAQKTVQLESIETFVDENSSALGGGYLPVTKYLLEYISSSNSGKTLLDSLTECGFDAIGNTVCAEPLKFAWSEAEPGYENAGNYLLECSTKGAIFASMALDINNDGYTDILSVEDVSIAPQAGALTLWHLALGTPEGCFQEVAGFTKFINNLAYPILRPIATKKGTVIAAIRPILAPNSNDPNSYGYFIVDLLSFEFNGVDIIPRRSNLPGPFSIQHPHEANAVYRTWKAQTGSLEAADFNGDGLSDIWFAGAMFFQKTNEDGWDIINQEYTLGFIQPNHGNYHTDWNSDGLTDSVSVVERADGFDVDLIQNFGNSEPAALNPTESFPASDVKNFFGAFISHGDLQVYYMSFFNVKSMPSPVFVSFGDFDADGNKDLVFHREDRWFVRRGTGLGFTEAQDIGFSTTTQTNHYFFVKDYNHDGRDDIFIIDEPTSGNKAWRVLIAEEKNQELAFRKIHMDPFHGHNSSLLTVQNAVEAGNVFRGDFNNDGVVDFYKSGHVGMWNVTNNAMYAKGIMPIQDKLASVTNGFANVVSFKYSTLTDKINLGGPLYTPGGSAEDYQYPYVRPSRGMVVVKSMGVSNGLGGAVETFYSYEGGKVDLRGRGFLGFDKIKSYSPLRGLVYINEYRLDWPYTGSISRSREEGFLGEMYSDTETQYATQLDNPRLVFPAVVVKKEYYGQGQVLSVTKTERMVDAFGGVVKEKNQRGTGLSTQGEVTGVLRSSLVINEIVNDTNNWLIGFVKSTSHAARNGSLAGWVMPIADEETQVVDASFVPVSGTLDIQTQTEFVGSSLEKTTRYTRDRSSGALPGVVTRTSLSAQAFDGKTLPDRSEYYENFKKGIFPETQKNALLHPFTRTYDLRFGLITSETDENGLTESSVFDPFGRVVYRADTIGTESEVVSYFCGHGPLSTYCPDGSAYYKITSIGHPESPFLGAALSFEFFDSLNRLVRSGETALSGELIFIDTIFNAAGYKSKESEPYKEGSAQYYTVFSQYDFFGDALRITEPDGGTVDIAYDLVEGMLRKTITRTIVDSDSIYSEKKQVYLNALSEISKVIDDLGVTIDYGYDSLGRIHSTEINQNSASLVVMDYDVAGHKVSVSDPAAGRIDFEYNGFGELERQVWQKGTLSEKSIRYSYDLLGRQLTRGDRSSDGSTESYTWVYDTKLSGRLSLVHGSGYREEYIYNPKGLVQSRLQTIPGASVRSFSYTYDAFGRAKTKRFPSGTEVEYAYSNNGFHTQTFDVSVAGQRSEIYSVGDAVDQRGNLYLSRYGNGIVTRQDFDPRNGYLLATKSGLATAASASNMANNIQHLSYRWDSVGNLQSRQSQRENLNGLQQESISERFTYDNLHRLKSSTTSWTGLMPRAVNYGYDDIGNLVLNASGTLRYDQTNGASLYGVTSANGKAYIYDAFGNVVRAGDKTLEYNVFNKPVRVGSTQFVYGPDHQKIAQIDGDTATYYFDGGQYEEVNSPLKSIQRVNVDGYYVKEKINSLTTISYLHYDHIGSVEAITDVSGDYQSRMRFDAFGGRLDSDWQNNPPDLSTDLLDLTWGFTGHDMIDQEGLIHMEGRIFDPAIGRFYSADLFIQAPFNPQSYNRYSYVFNNPLSYTDPSGYEATGDLEEVVVIGNRDSGWGGLHLEAMLMDLTSSVQDHAVDGPGHEYWGAGVYIVAAWGDELLGDAAAGVDSLSNGEMIDATIEIVFAVAKPLKAGNMVRKSFGEKIKDGLKTLKNKLLPCKLSAHNCGGVAKNGLKRAEAARDAELGEIAKLSKTQQSKITTVVGAHDPATGRIAVGVKRTCAANAGKCAEDLASEALGNPKNIEFTKVIRPRNENVIPRCDRCTGKYGPEN